MANRVLDGIRVLDFSRYIAGAFSTRWLADMGADVLKIEPPGGDFRHNNLVRKKDGNLQMSLHADNAAVGGLHGGFLYSNAGKRSLCMDIKAPGAMELVRQLIAVADVVIESSTPHVFKGWGLTYDEMRRIKPDIVFVQASGFGQDEPDQRAVCTAPIAHAMSGFNQATGYPGDFPLENAFAIGDPLSATVTCIGILSALIHKLRTGEGQHVDTAMVDSMAMMDCAGLPHAAISRGEYRPTRSGHLGQVTLPMGIYKVGDEYVSVQAGGAGSGPISGWGSLCELMGRPELASDPEWATDDARRDKFEEVNNLVQTWVSDNFKDAESCAETLQSHHILAAKANSIVELLDHPHYKRRQLIVEVEHPLLGSLPIVNTQIKLSRTPTSVGRAPFLGEHNEEGLRDWLGLDIEAVQKLYNDGVLEQDTLVGALRTTGELPDPWA